MIKLRESFGKPAFKVVMAGLAISCLGAAVVAAPLSFTPKNKILATGQQAVHDQAAFHPLARGPALQLGRSAEEHDEDCVLITKMTGPDGRVYVTRGLACAE
jgi:hypothetical protein